MRAQAALEIGSSNGVSTIWLAPVMAETGGIVTGMEVPPGRAAEASANLRRAGLEECAQLIAGEARLTIGGIVGPFDLVLVDAETDDYVERCRAALPLPRRAGSSWRTA